MTKATDKQVWLIRKLGRELGYMVDGDASDMSHVLCLSRKSHWASLKVYEAKQLINRLLAETRGEYEHGMWTRKDT